MWSVKDSLVRVPQFWDLSNLAKRFVLVEKAARQLDILFILGASDPDGERTFNHEKRIAKGIIDYDYQYNTRYGIITYSDQAVNQMEFNGGKSNAKLFMDFIGWQGNGVALDDALEEAFRVFQKSPTVNSRKLVFVFVNQKTGAAKAELERRSQKLRKSGVNVVVIAIGSNPDDGEITRIVPHEKIIRGNSSGDVKPVVDQAGGILGNDPCLAIDCPYYGICVVIAQGLPSCACPLSYPDVYEPVCGSDFKSYSNVDVLKGAACQAQEELTVISSGKCGM